MPKDTKSSGYNKAPACESRGLGIKKEGENFDTPSIFHDFIQCPRVVNMTKCYLIVVFMGVCCCVCFLFIIFFCCQTLK